jgi:hypothetical protein
MLRGANRTARVLSATALLVLAGCSATQTVVLNGDGSGTMKLHLEVTRLLYDYVSGLAEVSGESRDPAGETIFDLAAIRDGFAAQPDITVQDVASPDQRSLDVQVAFDSLSRVFENQPGLQSANAVSLTQSDGLETLKIHLDRSNYRQIAAFFPMLESPVLKSLGPQVDQKTTEDDYLEMVRFSLGDDGPAQVRKSSITVTVQPEGEIVSQTGGTVRAGTVVFRIPLLGLLVLAAPLDYSMSFKPADAVKSPSEKHP